MEATIQPWKKRGFEILPEFKETAAQLEKDVEEIKEYLPQRGTSGSSGYDLRAIESAVIWPGKIAIVGTGLTAYMQQNEELQLRCRSSLAVKGLVVANGVGTIDSDYYGKHIKFILMNAGEQKIEIHQGDRIGQGVFSTYLTIDDDRPLSDNRTGGFGSTGAK